MSGPQPTRIELTVRQREIFERLNRRERSSQQLVRRCRIVLGAADGASNEQIGQGWGSSGPLRAGGGRGGRRQQRVWGWQKRKGWTTRA